MNWLVTFYSVFLYPVLSVSSRSATFSVSTASSLWTDYQFEQSHEVSKSPKNFSYSYIRSFSTFPSFLSVLSYFPLLEKTNSDEKGKRVFTVGYSPKRATVLQAMRGRGATKSRKYANRKRFCRIGVQRGHCDFSLMNRRQSHPIPKQYEDRMRDVPLTINLPNRFHMGSTKLRPVDPTVDHSLFYAIPRVVSLPPMVDIHTRHDLKEIGFPILGIMDKDTKCVDDYLHSSREFAMKAKVNSLMRKIRRKETAIGSTEGGNSDSQESECEKIKTFALKSSEVSVSSGNINETDSGTPGSCTESNTNRGEIRMYAEIGSAILRGNRYIEHPHRYSSKTNKYTYRPECMNYLEKPAEVNYHLRVGRPLRGKFYSRENNDIVDNTSSDRGSVELPEARALETESIDNCPQTNLYKPVSPTIPRNSPDSGDAGIYYAGGLLGIFLGGFEELKDNVYAGATPENERDAVKRYNIDGEETGSGISNSIYDGSHPITGEFDYKHARDWKRFKEIVYGDNRNEPTTTDDIKHINSRIMNKSLQGVRMMHGVYKGVPLESIVKTMDRNRNPQLIRQFKLNAYNKVEKNYNLDNTIYNPLNNSNPRVPLRGTKAWGFIHNPAQSLKLLSQWNKDNPNLQPVNLDLFKYDILFCDQKGTIVYIKECAPPYNMELGNTREMAGREPRFIIQTEVGYIRARNVKVGDICEYVNQDFRDRVFDNHFALPKKYRAPLLLPDGRYVK